MNLQSAIKAIKTNHQSSARIEAAILGMLAATESSVGTTVFFEDTRAVLDELALAKASLDIAAWHTPEVTSTTAFLLSRAQDFVDAETIAPTEWPTPTELLHAVRAASNELSNDGPSP
jgi:hypothetical protein